MSGTQGEGSLGEVNPAAHALVKTRDEGAIHILDAYWLRSPINKM